MNLIYTTDIVNIIKTVLLVEISGLKRNPSLDDLNKMGAPVSHGVRGLYCAYLYLRLAKKITQSQCPTDPLFPSAKKGLCGLEGIMALTTGVNNGFNMASAKQLVPSHCLMFKALFIMKPPKYNGLLI